MLKLLIFLAFFYFAECGLAILLCKEPSSWGRKILNQIYQENEIDICFVGGSQVLQGIDPEIASVQLGGTAVNITSSQQPPTATATLVRELVREHPEVSRIYVSLDYSLLMTTDINLESIYIVSDALKLSWNKIWYLLRATPQEYYVNSFLPLRRGESYATSLHDMKNNLEALRRENRQGRECVGGFADNVGMNEEAFEVLASEVSAGDKIVSKADEDGQVVLPERTVRALEDIVKVCNTNDIQLIFFATPLPQFMTDAITDYDQYVQEVERILSDAGISYYDFNTEMSEAVMSEIHKFDRNKAENFTDEYHLSGTGAKRFTELLLESLEVNQR